MSSSLSSMHKQTISVIIPVHNGGEEFRNCLSNMVATQPPPDEIIVVADGDSDGSWRLAQEFEVQLINIPVACGPARARNLGAQKARGDILFFIDADVAAAPDSIYQIRETFEQDPDLAAVLGSYDDQPAASNFLSQYKNLFHHYIHQTGQEEASTFWTGCGAIRREIFLELGGFDTIYDRPCIEDIELGYRLIKAGYRIRLNPRLLAKHLKRWDVNSMLKADFFYRALPWTELILRDRQLVNDLNLGGTSRASVMSVFALMGALIGAIWWPGFWVIASGLCFLLLALNLPVYRFFQRKRGVVFAIKVIPWHWFYYFYGGLAFIIGIGLYLTGRWTWSGQKSSAGSRGLSYLEE